MPTGAHSDLYVLSAPCVPIGKVIYVFPGSNAVPVTLGTFTARDKTLRVF
jgi:hypothetical protein